MSSEVYQLFFNDSNYTKEYKKLVGIFSEKEDAINLINDILIVNNLHEIKDVEHLKSSLSQFGQVEIEHDFCLSLECAKFNTPINLYY